MRLKKKMGYCLYLPLLILIVVSCKQQTKEDGLEQRVFVVNITQGAQKLEEYLQYHKAVWPEVEAGFKKAGYREITLSRFEHLLVMTLLVPRGANLDSMGKIAESYDQRCAVWNRLMDTYQVGVPGTAQEQKWVEAKAFYSFTNP